MMEGNMRNSNLRKESVGDMTFENFPLPYGAYPLGQGIDGIRFSFPSQEEDCGVLVYQRGSGRLLKKHAFRPQDRLGSIRYGVVTGFPAEGISYLFYRGNQVFPDRWGRAYELQGKYGAPRSPGDYRAVIDDASYDWGGDACPRVPYEDALCYGIHVRGFTMHASSKVKARGTFAGIGEKLDYLQGLGVTTLELQPIYEQIEMEDAQTSEEYNRELYQPREPRLNYWGYQEGYYYAPKSGYAASADAATELRELVKALHARGMELILQFYFPDHISTDEILDVLRYWIWAYHVDGFHLMGGNLQVMAIASDPALSDCKLWYYDFPTEQIYGYQKIPAYRNLAVYNDGFQQEMRRFLKGDEGMLQGVAQRMRCNPLQKGIINYFSDYAGFTMMDLVSYDRKHNEENGEDNRDGSDCNFSWNCGAEGPSRKKQVTALRMKQLRNAFTLLMLSQGTPYIFMGDEFGRTQKGNNNPYCQDNGVTWVNWRDLERRRVLHDYVQGLIRLRRRYGIFHLERECRLMDYRSCGSPDLSYHGTEAWRPAWEPYNRHIGLMLNGAYGGEGQEDCWYIAVNMHWEGHDFALPRLPKGQVWRKVLDTEEGEQAEEKEPLDRKRVQAAGEGQTVGTSPRSITLYQSVRL